MGLTISVGGLKESTDDPETHLDEHRRFKQINTALRKAGLVEHDEPHIDAVWSYGTGYSSLHYLRRMAAHLWAGKGLPPPWTGEESPTKDPMFRKYDSIWGIGPLGLFSSLGRKRPAFTHLMHHGDAEGVYLPQDFREVIFDDVPGGMIGSSYRLKEECKVLAGHLELSLDLDPGGDWEEFERQIASGSVSGAYLIESGMCLALYHASCHSIRTGAAVSFG